MAIIKPLRGFTPVIGKDCFLADNAVVIGGVIMGGECSIWFSTVLRGDVNSIRIGNRVNVQDGSVFSHLYQKSTIEIGGDVSIGHNVVIHGAKIRDYALIGMECSGDGRRRSGRKAYSGCRLCGSEPHKNRLTNYGRELRPNS